MDTVLGIVAIVALVVMVVLNKRVRFRWGKDGGTFEANNPDKFED